MPDEHAIVKNGDIISHTMHRHEPPVTASPILTVHEDNDLIVVNKPSGLPVHPAGRYNYNSLVEILRAERGHGFNPLPCNRLDRLTSGIMFIGKHSKAAENMTVQLTQRTVRKEYVARVVGEFPEGETICEQPMLSISPKLGLNRVRATGKEARTVFKRLAYYPARNETSGVQANHSKIANESHPSEEAEGGSTTSNGMPWKRRSGYSIVRCLPLTGRTHQIRVHLQFLGNPISNDPIYCNQKVFGQDLGRGDDSAATDEDIITRLMRMGKEEVADAVAYHDEMVTEYERKKAEKMTGETCEVCDTPLYSDPGVHELGIYLHAMKYRDMDDKWSYSTELPNWALPPDGVDGPLVATDDSDPARVVEKLAGLKLDGVKASDAIPNGTSNAA